MNPQETQQVVARDEKWVPSTERVKISSTNVRLETTMQQKEETFQVVIEVIKNSTCFKAFTITTKVPEIFMQQFLYTIKKVKDSESYEFLLANKKCIVDADVFRKIPNICPRVEGEELRYKMMMLLSPSLLTLDTKIDHKKERKSRRKTIPFPQFTKVIINHFLSQHKSLSKLQFQHYHTMKDDGIVRRLKFVRIKEDYQEYRRPIPDMMLNDKIKQSESYQMFIKYSSGRILPKKSRGKGSQGNKTADVSQESVDVSKESESKPAKKNTISKRTGRIPGVPDESIVISATSHEGTSTKPGVPDKEKVISEANVFLKWGSENQSEHFDDSQLNFDDKEMKDKDDESYKYKTLVRKDEDEEMTNAEVKESGNGDEENTDAAKTDAEKTKEVKDDAKKAELPPTSSSLSVSSVAKLENDVSELKKIDHSIKALATLKSQVPTVVVQYLRSKIDDDLQKVLQRYTADIIQKYSMKPAPESSKIQKPTIDLEQESEKSASEIRKIKKEQAEKQKIPIKNHKRQHDDDDDDDDNEDPSVDQTREPIEELIVEVVMDDAFNTAGEYVVRDDDKLHDTSKPKTNKTPNQDWFKQPPWPPNPNPE
ncbi:hypothetical protein Tco_0990722 [Tanacetum coccineum]|uniref:Uncharacterized protein n=1 Tax=Tanacetum coccineum TaxID=301880 RepID=A0ABQ5EY20_9ASTR